MSTNRTQNKAERKRRLINRKRRIQWRLRNRQWTDQPRPMFAAGNIHYELADRARGLGPGDFCRRFEAVGVEIPMNTINNVRVKVWQQQPASFSEEAVIEGDGVMASLAWTLKAWFALLLPERGRWKQKHRHEKIAVLRMGFKRFVNAFVRVPCHVVRTDGRLVYRLLAWNPWQHVFLRGVDALHVMSTWRHPLRC